MKVSDAVILMAGSGTRLGVPGGAPPKPLVPIQGRPLISYAIATLAAAGVENLHVVVGPNGDKLVAMLRPLVEPQLRLNPIANPDWQKQNGVSVLKAAGVARAPFLLLMADHLFEPAMLDRLLAQAEPADLNLAVDYKIDAIFDLDDAMKVQTRAGRVMEISKTLPAYNAIDTGMFLCPDALFDYLRGAQKDGDCSLADGVRAMAADGRVRAVDIGDAWWQDVDTPEMLQQAQERLPEIFKQRPRPDAA